MFSLRSLSKASLFAFAVSLVPSLVLADEVNLVDRTQHIVEDGLLKPLAAQESHYSRFSRGRPVPHERRLRVTQTSAAFDKSGRSFLSFAVDIRYGGSGGEWRENDIVGCAYTQDGKLFVKMGDEYRPASVMLGKDEAPVTGVCEAAPPPPARS